MLLIYIKVKKKKLKIFTITNSNCFNVVEYILNFIIYVYFLINIIYLKIQHIQKRKEKKGKISKNCVFEIILLTYMKKIHQNLNFVYAFLYVCELE